MWTAKQSNGNDHILYNTSMQSYRDTVYMHNLTASNTVPSYLAEQLFKADASNTDGLKMQPIKVKK